MKLVTRKFYEYLFPTFMMTVAMSITLLLTSVIVGNLLGTSALAAVNLNNPIMNLISAVVNVFVFGAVAVIAILKGKLNAEDANKTFSMTLAIGLLAVLLVTALSFYKVDYIAGILCNWESQELYELTKDYLFPLIFCFPLLFIFLSIATIMRVDGFPKFSAFVLIFSNVVNIVLGYILIKYFHFGISGSSWAIFIGYFIGIVLLSYYFFSKDRALKFTKFNLSDVKNLLSKVIMTGMPNGATNIFMLLRIFILNIYILSIFSTIGAAVYALCVNIVYFAYIFARGVANTIIAIIGVLYGEKDYRGIFRILRTAFIVVLSTSVIFFTIFAFFPDLICNLYGMKLEEEIVLAHKALKAFAFCTPIFGINYVFMCYFQCIKREKFALVISGLDNFALVVLFTMLLAKINNDLLWWGYPIAEIAMLLIIVSYCIYNSKKYNLAFPFLTPNDEILKTLDISLNNNENEIEKSKKMVSDFCKNKIVNEEQTSVTNAITGEIIGYLSKITKYKSNFLDIKLSISQENMQIRFRNNEYTDIKDIHSILANFEGKIKEFQFAKNIGFNIFVVKI